MINGLNCPYVKITYGEYLKTLETAKKMINVIDNLELIVEIQRNMLIDKKLNDRDKTFLSMISSYKKDIEITMAQLKSTQN